MLLDPNEVKILCRFLETAKKKSGILIAENNLLLRCQHYLHRLPKKSEIAPRSPSEAEQIEHEKDYEEDKNGTYR